MRRDNTNAMYESPIGSSSPLVALTFLSPEEWMALIRVLRLSPREATIADLAVGDNSDDMIAQQLGISRHTVHTHLDRIYTKLGVHSRCQLAVRIFRTYVTATADPTSPLAS